MANITPLEPEFSPDFIEDGGIVEVIDELRRKINELIHAHNASLAAAAAPAPLLGTVPSGGRRTRRRRKRRRKRRS